MRGVKEGKVMLVGTNPSWREYYKGIPFWKSRVGSYIARQLLGIGLPPGLIELWQKGTE